MNDATKRWPQFVRLRLRTLMMLVSACAILLGARDYLCRPYQSQYDAKVKLEQLGGIVRLEPAAPSWMRYIVGEKRFENVVELSLFGRDISDKDLALIAHMPELRKLDVEGANVTNESMKLVGRLPKLQELDIASTSVTDAGLKNLANCNQLLKVSLPTRISDLGIAHLGHCTRLHTVTGGNISLRGWGALAGTQLSSIRLFDEEIDDSQWGVLSDLASLQELHVTGVDDAKRLFSHLSDLRYMTKLSASSTSIDDFAIAELVKIPNLSEVDLYTTRVSIDGLKVLLNKPTMRNLRLESSLIFPEEVASTFLEATHIESCQIWTPWVAKGGFFEMLNKRLTDEQRRAGEGKMILPIPQTNNMMDYRIHQPSAWLRPDDFTVAQLEDRPRLHFGGLEGEIDLRILKSMKELRHLTVPDTIDDAGLKQVAELTQLESLYINSSRITPGGLRNLAALKNLREIEVDGTWLMQEDKKWLSKTFPDASIEFGLRSLPASTRNNLRYVGAENLSGISRNAIRESTSHAYKIAKTWPRPLSFSVHVPLAANKRLMHFLELPNVEEIHISLSESEARSVIEALARNTSLKHLTLHGDVVGDDDIALISHLKLSSLGLRQTGVTPACLAYLKNMPLQSLHFAWWPDSDNQSRFFDATNRFRELADIPTLRELEIDTAIVDDEDLAGIASLSQLNLLSISGDTISPEGIGSLCKLRNLESIAISLREAPEPKILSPLGSLPRLNVIELDLIGMYEREKDYQMALPKIKIIARDSCSK